MSFSILNRNVLSDIKYYVIQIYEIVELVSHRTDRGGSIVLLRFALFNSVLQSVINYEMSARRIFLSDSRRLFSAVLLSRVDPLL
jgi:hypothetical protein